MEPSILALILILLSFSPTFFLNLSLSVSCRTSLPSLASVHVPPCAATMTAQLKAAPAHTDATDFCSQNALVSHSGPLTRTDKHFNSQLKTAGSQYCPTEYKSFFFFSDLITFWVIKSVIVVIYLEELLFCTWINLQQFHFCLIFVLIYIQKYIYCRFVNWSTFFYHLKHLGGKQF